MPDDIEQSFMHAIEVGRENERLVSLGKAWCAHIRTDRSLMGVGLLEQVSGLPVTGGRFACDFARAPVGVEAMQLEVSALPFYEDNCVGCPNRSPGGRIPNLGTWAEEIIAERSRREAADVDAERAADEECRHRMAERTRLGARLSAASQEVIGAVNRLDANPTDRNAAVSLRDAARLAPDSFPVDVKEMLYQDARLLGRAVLLEVLIALDSQDNPPALHSLCVDAAVDGWAIAEGFRYLSEHGVAGDVSDEFLGAVVFHAAEKGLPWCREPGDGAALLHYHSLAPEPVEEKLSSLLRHGDPHFRAAAGSASQSLIPERRDVGERLLPALLDGLRFHEDPTDLREATAEVSQAVGLVLQGSTDVAGAEIKRRWDGASPEYRVRLLGCYDSFLRSFPRGQEVPVEIGSAALGLAVDALSEPDGPHSHRSYSEDFRSRAADLLRIAARRCPAASPSTERLLGLLLEWIERRSGLAESQEDDLLDAMAKEGTRITMGKVIDDIGAAAIEVAGSGPAAFLGLCSDFYGGSESQPVVQAEAVAMAGSAAEKFPEHLNDALPLIYTATLSAPLQVRFSGIRAAIAATRGIPSESIPPLLALAVAAGLQDQYLAVVAEAVKAMQHMPADLINTRQTVSHLLVIAASYAADRLHDQLVEDALSAALRLAHSDEELLASVAKSALQAVDMMPPYGARKVLQWHSALREQEGWADTAIRALRPDDDLQYESLSWKGDDGEGLLAELARRSLAPHQIESLADTAIEAGRTNHARCLYSADALAELGRPDLSAEVFRAHLGEIPDTIENRWQRRSIGLVVLRFELEDAIASGDRERQSGIVEQAKSLLGEDEPHDLESTSLASALSGNTVGGAMSEIARGSATAGDAKILLEIEARAALIDSLHSISTGDDASGDDFNVAIGDCMENLGSGADGDVIWAFSEVADSLVLAVRWRTASWEAEPDADRFARAARLRAEAVVEQAGDTWPSALLSAARRLAGLDGQNGPAEIADLLSRVPLPPRMTRKPHRQAISEDPGQQAPVPSVALLVRFNSEPVMRPTVLRPGAMHQLQVEARVSEWPDNAEMLEVEFLSVHPREFLHSSKLAFTPDQLQQPLEIRIAGERPSTDPPLSLTALARFRSGGEPIEARLAGNTTLELTTFHPDTATPPGQPEAARRLQEIMSELRNAYPDQSEEDRRDIRLLLAGILRFAHNELDNRLGAQQDIDEAWFQSELLYFLRADPNIGAQLEQRVGRAGGLTDLILGRTVVELKLEKGTPITLEAAESRYAGQATQYASAGDARVSLLVVLDASPKRAPSGVMGNEMKWAYPETASGPSAPLPSLVGIAIVRSGFPRPSDFSL
ncbi:MAG: hypothetical protein OXT07_06140 [bacterium]|nr:hypothetical protein [bacterium]